MSTFQPGEIVNITIKGARVVDLHQDGSGSGTATTTVMTYHPGRTRR